MQEVNLLALAAANGQIATLDPMTSALLTKIRTATDGGSLEEIDVNLNRFRFNVPTESLRRYPTFRIDLNVTDKHRFSSAYNYQYFTDFPDTLNNHDQSFPGFTVAAGQKSERLGFANSLRSTLSQDLVNEARVGYSSSPVTFFDEYTVDQFSDSSLNQGGFRLTFPSVNTDADEPEPCAGAAGPQRHQPPDREHADLAARESQLQHGRSLDAVRSVGEQLVLGPAGRIRRRHRRSGAELDVQRRQTSPGRRMPT